MRADLPPGLQAAQAVHAAIEFTLQWRGIVARWNLESNNVVIISVPDEDALAAIAARAVEEGMVRTIFREPDVGNTITAVALQPGEDARRLCSQLPLALKEKVPI